MNRILMIFAAMTAITACGTDAPITPKNPYASGVFVMNEGAFSGGSGTITQYRPDSNKVAQNIFEKENNRPLGNIGQSMTLIGNQWYLVANGAAKVEIVDTNFKSVGVITDASIAQPRHIVGIDANTAVLSQWGSDGLTGKVLIINLQTKQITKTIATGAGAEQMVVANGKIYVANSGGFGNDSTVSVIDVATQTITKTLNVGDNPNSICVGNDGKIWVLCGGKQDFTNPANDTKGSVWRIDATTATIIDHADMPTNTFHPAKMVRGAGNKPVYFLSGAYGGQVYACSSPVVVEATPVFAGSYLALGTDQIRTSSGTDIYAASGSFTANGKAYRYNTTTQRMVDSFAVGLIPSFFAFK